MCESSSLSLDSISPTPISCRRRFTQVRYQYLDPEYIYKHSSATSLVEYVSIPRKQESIEENEGRYAYTFVTRSPICLSLVFGVRLSTDFLHICAVWEYKQNPSAVVSRTIWLQCQSTIECGGVTESPKLNMPIWKPWSTFTRTHYLQTCVCVKAGNG